MRQLSQAPPFAWAHYAFTQKDDVLTFVQDLGPSAAKNVGDVGWDGEEVVAVRLHIPSRVTWHNAPSHLVERGNIVSWEQPLKARLAGEPLRVEARFGVQRILVLTVALFLAAMAAAAVTVVLVTALPALALTAVVLPQIARHVVGDAASPRLRSAVVAVCAAGLAASLIAPAL